MPMEKFENGAWPHPARLPLGCGWSGHCTAPGHEGELPEAEDLRGCNLGYADSCSRRPKECLWDAVRFAVKAAALRANPGGAEGGISEIQPRQRVIEVKYVCERQHRPVEHGTLEFDAIAFTWLRPHADFRVQKMAACFLESYMKDETCGQSARTKVRLEPHDKLKIESQVETKS
jgi:hypothetical protein